MPMDSRLLHSGQENRIAMGATSPRSESPSRNVHARPHHERLVGATNAPNRSGFLFYATAHFLATKRIGTAAGPSQFARPLCLMTSRAPLLYNQNVSPFTC